MINFKFFDRMTDNRTLNLPEKGFSVKILKKVALSLIQDLQKIQCDSIFV